MIITRQMPASQLQDLHADHAMNSGSAVSAEAAQVRIRN